MNTALDDHPDRAAAARDAPPRRLIARAASRIGAMRRRLYRLSLGMLRFGLWLRRAGLPSEARLALRVSRWAWRTASGLQAVRRQADAHRERRPWMSRVS